MTPREHVIRVRCERGYSEGRDDDFAAADATFLLAALDRVTAQRDEIQANRDALAHKVAEQRAVIEHGPFWATGICPKCRRCKFIGHGPLCVDCLMAATTTDGSKA